MLLPDKAKVAMSSVVDDMKSVPMIRDVDFSDLLGAHADFPADSLEGKVDLVLAESTNNMRNERSRDNSLRRLFILEAMSPLWSWRIN